MTTILPGARTTLVDGLAWRHSGGIWSKVHPRFQTPVWGTVIYGAVSLVWYVGTDAAEPERAGRLHRGPGPYHRLLLRHQRVRRSAVLPAPHVRDDFKTFFMLGVFPLIGGLILLWVLASLVRPASGIRPTLPPAPPGSASGRPSCSAPGSSSSSASSGMLAGLVVPQARSQAVLRAQDGDSRRHGALVRGEPEEQHDRVARRAARRPGERDAAAWKGGLRGGPAARRPDGDLVAPGRAGQDIPGPRAARAAAPRSGRKGGGGHRPPPPFVRSRRVAARFGGREGESVRRVAAGYRSPRRARGQ
jgi:hypothetical protein